MTTAHRPTFHTAIGGKEQGGGRYIAGVSRTHVHDQKSQMSIKLRAPAKPAPDNMLAALEARENEHLKAIGKAPRAAPPPPPPPMDSDDDDDDEAVLVDPNDADDKHLASVVTAKGGILHGKAAAAAAATSSTAFDDDADDDAEAGGGGGGEDDEDESSDDDDEEEELMRELERIKKERAEEAAKQEQREAEEASADYDNAVLQANPLLDPTARGGSSSFAVKRRWDDDVVFRNQSREPKQDGPRFINDTVRNDFHRRFLNKYIK